MVKPRTRQTPATDRQIEEFANRAEQQSVPVPVATQPDLPAWKIRNKEKKTTGLNFRTSTSQMNLLRAAAELEEISQQKLLERIVWPILEERYGSGTAENA
ncbi:hypothetical protein [Paeniglutamicibacter kerguelensis]|uniref:ParB n=1 Tax=Paeniglutamicibacter kerguelensis TaxID=254788 RepID=A0ABS4XJ25_9MICC|nr:hypothetical protein [Paeniglutamicibacter kerguelensis]MBP2388366.1 hypothetical protein [Paeniglutamicibacter kerguelensis]